MKTCIVTTIKTKNRRLPNKTFKLLNGKPLYTYIFNTLKSIQNERKANIFIDSSDEKVLSIAREWGFNTLIRPEEYNADHIQGHQLLSRILDKLDYEIIGWVLITTPFLKKETILKSIKLMEEDETIDSLFGVVPIQNRLWFKNKPINHDIENLVGTQELIPVHEEADFYFIRKNSYKKYRHRICGNYKTVEVDDIEGVDIDTALDLHNAESILKTNKKIIVVGTGDLYYRFLSPALKILNDSGDIIMLATVDIEEKKLQGEDSFPDLNHIIRKEDEKLSDILHDFKNEDPIIILGHATNFHLTDTKDLVSNGFKVISEKPYSINHKELESLKDLIRKYPDKISLMEYHLMRKAIPFLVLEKLIKKDSFFLNSEEVIRKAEFMNNPLFHIKDIKNLTGEIKKIDIEILESEDEIGKLDHRGSHLFDNTKGGGMIQDLGMHALIPIFVLDNVFGKVDITFKDGEVNVDYAKEYINLAKNTHLLPEENIAESFAQIKFLTDKNIPVNVKVGKYVPHKENQRKFVITGEKASLLLDYHNNDLWFVDTDGNKEKLLELSNLKNSRYLSVIKTAIEKLSGNDVFSFDHTQKLIDCQELILNILKKLKNSNHNESSNYF
ncbi:MAG: hypothetical protein KJ592_01370 [Nanoarchaeota archaeon]|nr:hypothetical protein [Nanoarchaeota archaeon]